MGTMDCEKQRGRFFNSRLHRARTHEDYDETFHAPPITNRLYRQRNRAKDCTAGHCQAMIDYGSTDDDLLSLIVQGAMLIDLRVSRTSRVDQFVAAMRAIARRRLRIRTRPGAPHLRESQTR